LPPVEPGEILLRQFDVHRSYILLKMYDVPGMGGITGLHFST